MPERRTQGMLRVPFIRRCVLELAGGAAESAFLVNINVFGAYLARDAMPALGDTVSIRFRVPANDRELALTGVVTWVNARQQHPVHSLPPGFGVKFAGLDPEARRCIEEVVDDYIARNPQVLT